MKRQTLLEKERETEKEVRRQEKERESDREIEEITRKRKAKELEIELKRKEIAALGHGSEPKTAERKSWTETQEAVANLEKITVTVKGRSVEESLEDSVAKLSTPLVTPQQTPRKFVPLSAGTANRTLERMVTSFNVDNTPTPVLSLGDQWAEGRAPEEWSSFGNDHGYGPAATSFGADPGFGPSSSVVAPPCALDSPGLRRVTAPFLRNTRITMPTSNLVMATVGSGAANPQTSHPRLPDSRQELSSKLGWEVGVWSPKITQELENTRRSLFVTRETWNNQEHSALNPETRRKIHQEVLLSLYRVKDGRYGGMNFAVADPCVRVQTRGMYLDITWESIVTTWNHPQLTSETSARLGEIQILPLVHASWRDLERHEQDAASFQLTQPDKCPIRNAYFGWRFQLRFPGETKGSPARKSSVSK